MPSTNTDTQKKVKAQLARKQRSYIKERLKLALKDVEGVRENKGTDYLITTLVEHALQWKVAYLNSSSNQNDVTGIPVANVPIQYHHTLVAADEEAARQRRIFVKDQILDVLEGIHELPRQNGETDYDSLVSILVEYSKYWKACCDYFQQQNFTGNSAVTENYHFVQTEECLSNDERTGDRSSFPAESTVESFLKLLNEDNEPRSPSHNQHDREISLSAESNVGSFLRLLNEDDEPRPTSNEQDSIYTDSQIQEMLSNLLPNETRSHSPNVEVEDGSFPTDLDTKESSNENKPRSPDNVAEDAPSAKSNAEHSSSILPNENGNDENLTKQTQDDDGNILKETEIPSQKDIDERNYENLIYTISQREQFQETIQDILTKESYDSDNRITSTDEIVCTRSIRISRKRKRTFDKSTHTCNPKEKDRKFYKRVTKLVNELDSIIELK